MKRIFLLTLSFAFCHLSPGIADDQLKPTTIQTPATMPLHTQTHTLTLSGDVIFQWNRFHATSRNKKLRGSGAINYNPEKNPILTNEFSTQVDLFLDYQADPTYAKIQFEFDNDSGILSDCLKGSRKSKRNSLSGSGELSALSLLKAYMGYHLLEKEYQTLSLELGRRPLYDILTSKVQFNSNSDGAVCSYWRSSDTLGEFSGKACGFIIDQTVKHFGYAGELNFYSIYGSKFDLTYSLISWDRKGYNRYNKRHSLGSRFINSQLLMTYNLPETWVKSPFVYLAGLHNHAAKASSFTHHKKASNAFYGGFTLGEIQKKNDWSLDLNYQWVQAQAIAQNDVAGIGRDNPLGLSLYRYSWAGNTNYKGYVMTYIYALTDTLTLTSLYSNTHQASRAIGGKFRASNFQLSATYNF